MSNQKTVFSSKLYFQDLFNFLREKGYKVFILSKASLWVINKASFHKSVTSNNSILDRVNYLEFIFEHLPHLGIHIHDIVLNNLL